MNFEVQWTDLAMGELAGVAERYSDTEHESIIDAVRTIRAELSVRAPTVGESRNGDHRIFLASPIGIIYGVDESIRVARIERVWWYGRR